jgi:hypothetical protein
MTDWRYFEFFRGNQTNSPGAIQQVGIGDNFSQSAFTQNHHELVTAIDRALASTEFTQLNQDQKDAFSDTAVVVKEEASKSTPDVDLFSGRTAVSKQSVLASSSTVAMLCAPVLGGIVLTAFGWRVNCAILPFSGIVLGLCTAVFLPETRNAREIPLPQPASGLFVSYVRVLRDPDAVGFALLNAITFEGMFAYISGLSLVFIGTFGVNPSMFGLLFAAAALALLAGSTLSVFAVKQMSPRLLRQAGLGILAFATSLLIAAAAFGGLSILLIGLASFTFACGIILPNATAAAMASQPEISGAASGVFGATQFISGATGAAMSVCFTLERWAEWSQPWRSLRSSVSSWVLRSIDDGRLRYRPSHVLKTTDHHLGSAFRAMNVAGCAIFRIYKYDVRRLAPGGIDCQKDHRLGEKFGYCMHRAAFKK